MLEALVPLASIWDTPQHASAHHGAISPQVRCWMLSCRSLHLGIEHLMIRHLARVAAARGAI
jgi:hypothetical protein